ncbi:glycosyltransferase [Lebetimonas sp. JH369]|uniref:glycosyltransferase n=1 Tax=Lebetimonas sp. JH369 TaxID=990069 RepID=UPI0021019D56|nr:glycosyltransferase [Lebetimonas sp. JH369]
MYSLASGGAERQVSILLKKFSKEYNVTLVLMNDTIFYEVPKNIKIVYIEKSAPFESGVKKLLKLPFLALKYKKILKEKNIDVSISFMNRPNYINTLAKIFWSKTKTIISERAMPSLQHKSSIQGKINKFLIKTLYKKADIVLANSKGNQKDLIKNFNIKSKVIYNMLDFNCKKEEKFKKFTFITIGRLDEGKNHKLLIEAFKKANLDAELLIIGDGYLRDDLEFMIKDLGLKDKVKLLGRQKDVFRFLSQADCFVFSSNYEGFPNVLLEALACNLPVISTDCKSGPREILAPDTTFTKQTKEIELAEYGILVPVGDVDKMVEAMRMIYKNSDLRYNYEQKAKKRIKEFEVKKIIKKWEKIIGEKNEFFWIFKG